MSTITNDEHLKGLTQHWSADRRAATYEELVATHGAEGLPVLMAHALVYDDPAMAIKLSERFGENQFVATRAVLMCMSNRPDYAFEALARRRAEARDA